MHAWLARRLVYPLHERLMRRPTFPYLVELEKSQWLGRAELEALQYEKLHSLLRLAEEHCPWHARRIREAGIETSRPLSLSAFRRLPLMSKADAVAHGKDMVWRGAPGGAYSYNTGGSTGEPLIFYYGRRRQASDAAGRIRARRWWGVDAGEREVYLWGAPIELSRTDRIKQVRDRLLNQLVLNAFDMSVNHMDEYCRAIQWYRPHCLYGYASSLALLAAHAREKGFRFRLPELKVVCATGEPLYPHQRDLIQKVYGAPAANEFGSRDIGFTAHETPQGQMLLMSESILLEVLDELGQPVLPGETGEAVMTGLESQAQPFIRYRTGDLVRASAERCVAGRGLHVVGEIFGRTTDFLVRSDGTIMHALAGIYVLRAVVGVAEFKLIQNSCQRIEVLIVPNALWMDGSALQVVTGLRQRMGEDVAIEVRIVDHIPPERSGKHRYVVSHVHLSEPLAAASHLN